MLFKSHKLTETLFMKIFIPPLAFILATALQGCAGLLFGGALVTGIGVAITAHDRRTLGAIVDDKSLELAITKQINKTFDKKIHTNLTIFNGTVLLTGEAESKEIADDILKIIQNTANVKRIESDIAIMPQSGIVSRANDATITGKVKIALLSLKLPYFDPTFVNVSTERGKVYIMGLVTKEEARAIIDKARRVRSVKSVTDVFEYIQPEQIKKE